MAISKRTSIDPGSMQANWSKGVAASGGKWLKGVQSPRKLPNENPDQNVSNWQTGVSSAGPAMKAGITSPNYLTRLEAGATAKQSSYAGAGSAHAADFGAAAQKLSGMIQEAMGTLPAKGPRGTNAQRSVAFAEAMHSKRGQAKVR